MKMNFIIYILLVFTFSSINQGSGKVYEVVTKKKHYIDKLKRTGYVLDNQNFIGFSTSKIDSKTGEWLKHLVYFSPKNRWLGKVVSTTDLSDGFYGDTLLFYKDNFSDKQVFIWKQEGEYWSYLNIYLFYNDNIEFIVDLSVGLDCNNCDVFNFPDSKIEIREVTNGLKILFKGQSVFRGSISQNISYHSVNIKTDKLILQYDGTKCKISY